MAALSKPVLPQNDNVAHALAGSGGGILSMILTYPLVTLSTRAQVDASKARTSFLAAVRDILAREGITGLYAGLDTAIFGIAVTNFIYYYWYEWSRAFFTAARARRAGALASRAALSPLESMAAGALAGCATVLMTNPIWVVNTRMTTAAANTTPEGEVLGKPKAKPSTVKTVLHLLKTEGPSAFFRGVGPALVLVANPILQYTLFEQLRNAYERRRGRGAVTPGVTFALGALGKLFATSVTYPYITVKSQMHVARAGEREGMGEALRRIVREKGYGGLYGGIGPKVTQSVLTAAFLFAFKDVLYEQSVKLRRTMAQRALKA